MRKLIRFLPVIIIIITLSLAACTPESGGNYSFDNGKKESTVLQNITEYTVVRGDLSSDTEKEALVLFRDTVKKNLGTELLVGTDWLDKGKSPYEYEILIGDTNRAETQKAIKNLGYNDFVIKMSGKKLVIAGGSDDSTLKAVKYFLENYIDIYNGTLSYPTKAYIHTQTYTLSSVSINGTPISDFKLFCADSEIDLTDVQSAITDKLAGVLLKIATSFDPTEKYIIFDRTSILVHEYGIELKNDGNLYVFGSYSSFDNAKEYFMNDYFSELVSEKNSSDIDITWHDNKTLKNNSNTPYTKEELLDYLNGIYSQKTSLIWGETLGGSQITPSYASETFKNATGTFLPMIGLDLGCYGMRLTELSETEWSESICSLTEYAEKGGIISLTARFQNPTGNWPKGGECYGELGGNKDWEELLTADSELNKKFTQELTSVATYIKALCDNGVSVIWQPLPESNTDKYWFGALQNGKKTDKELVSRLWVYIYEYFKSAGIDNVIWAYAPSLTKDSSVLEPMYGYPGDEYTDIIGCHVELMEKGDLALLANLSEIVADSGKTGAICGVTIKNESNISGATREEQSSLYSVRDIIDELDRLIFRGESFAYILTASSGTSASWLGFGEEIAKSELIITTPFQKQEEK
ncbi:MAG: glycosyl hydrolase [Clostridia bacterium]|nr:glycosyl hydrolase [Clostridia bacterium]